MDFYERERQIEHPMEDVLGIEPGSTTITEYALMPQELVDHPEYDSKDKEIEQQAQEVYEMAVQAFQQQMGVPQTTEPRNQARMSEVANGFLTTALQALQLKTTLKTTKDKLKAAKSVAQQPTVNNNLIIDRNSLMRMIKDLPPEEDGRIFDHDGPTDT